MLVHSIHATSANIQQSDAAANPSDNKSSEDFPSVANSVPLTKLKKPDFACTQAQ